MLATQGRTGPLGATRGRTGPHGAAGAGWTEADPPVDLHLLFTQVLWRQPVSGKWGFCLRKRGEGAEGSRRSPCPQSQTTNSLLEFALFVLFLQRLGVGAGGIQKPGRKREDR